MTIGGCAWRPAPDGSRSELELPDGRAIQSAPHPTGEYETRSRELGYPSGAAMSLEHDAIHAALANVFGTVSPVLLDVVDGAERDRWQEEELVKLVACRLNDPSQDGDPGGGLVRHLRTLLRGPIGTAEQKASSTP